MDPLLRLKEIFLNGNAGIRPLIPMDFAALEQQASRKLSKRGFEYIKTGAGKHLGVKNNNDAFAKYAIKPHMLHGVKNAETKLKLFNTELHSPFMFAPVGVLGLVHKNADIELAEASKALNIPMVISNQASVSMEKITNSLENTDHWFQLYFGKSYELVESLIARAEKSRCSAIVLTVDTTIIGWRPLDLQSGFLPFMLGQGIAQYTSDPVFQKLMQEPHPIQAKPKVTLELLVNMVKLMWQYEGTFLGNFKSKDPIKAIQKFIEIYSKTDLNWDDVKWLRSRTQLPILIKGILTPEDAQKAIDLGIDGIIVSNHGGRQVDQVIASLDALVNIKSKIASDYQLLFDSGIRSGIDAFIALALGAKTVLIGRPYVYSMAIAGKLGVEEFMNNLLAEFKILMLLTGCKNLEDINQELLTHN